jgi:2-dehydropantoate 2-reductase
MACIAVIGAGGIGCLLAAYAHDRGHDVTLCARSSASVLRFAHGGVTREIPVRIVIDPDDVEPIEWVVIATKAQETVGAASWLERLVGDNTTVVVAQNGIDHEDRVRPLVGEAPILPALIYTAVERIGPADVIYHSGNGAIVPKGDRGDAFQALFDGSPLTFTQTDDFATAVWRKLLSNSAANPITALTLRRMDVMHEPDILALARELLLEVVATARAAGIALREEDADEVLALHQTYDVNGGTSMLYDRLAGRALEHEYLAGAVVRTADHYGVPVPRTRMILTLLRALRP